MTQHDNSTSPPPKSATSAADASPQEARVGGLRKLSIVGYGAGDAANNLAFTTATLFLLVYYTDSVGISAAAAGTLLLVVRIFDAFSDILAGRLVDRAYSKRFGKFRPFIMFGSVPLLLLSVATFSVPALGESGTLLYAYLSYAALGLAYSLVNIPFGSLAGAMTQVPAERAKLAGARTVGAVLVGAGLGIFVAPLLGRGNNLQALFTSLTLGFVVLGTALYFFTVVTTKERVIRAVPHVTFRQSVRTLRNNRPLLFLCLSSFLFLTGSFASQTANIYYLRDVMGALPLYSILAFANLVLIIPAAALMPTIVRHIGKRNAYIIGAIIMAVGGIVAFVAPVNLPGLAFTGLVVASAGALVINVLVWALEADTVEYGEWKTGVRAEGITYALFSFTRKSGQAVGGALAAYALAWGGYTVTSQVVGTSVEWGIRAAAGLIPLIAAAAAIVIMLLYPLTDKRHAEIVAEIAKRRDHVEPGLSTAALKVTDPGSSTPPIAL